MRTTETTEISTHYHDQSRLNGAVDSSNCALPSAWKSIRAGEALTLINGRTFKSTEWKKTGLPIIRIQNLNDRSAPFNYYDSELPERFLVGDNELLFAWSGTPGTSFGAHIWRGGKAWLNQHIFKVLFDPRVFERRFLRLAINQNLAEYIGRAHGAAGLAHITKARFEESELICPPLAEQHRIVAEIEKQFTRLDAGVASLKRVQTGLKRYRASVLKAACEGRLVPTEAEIARQEGRPYEHGSELLVRIIRDRRAQWESQQLVDFQASGKTPDEHWKSTYKEPRKLDRADLPELPKGWVWCLSDCLYTFVTSGSRGWAKYYSGEGPMFLRIGNLDHESVSLDLGDIRRVNPPSGAEGTRTKVKAGDFLISITADVGMIAVVPHEFGEAYINQHVALARPVATIFSKFVAWYLAAPDGGQRQFTRLQRGATKAGLGLDNIRDVPIPLPPLAEQERIVAEIERRLSVIEELEVVLTANIKRAERLRQSILHHAFSGRDLVHHAHHTC